MSNKFYKFTKDKKFILKNYDNILYITLEQSWDVDLYYKLKNIFNDDVCLFWLSTGLCFINETNFKEIIRFGNKRFILNKNNVELLDTLEINKDNFNFKCFYQFVTEEQMLLAKIIIDID